MMCVLIYTINQIFYKRNTSRRRSQTPRNITSSGYLAVFF